MTLCPVGEDLWTQLGDALDEWKDNGADVEGWDDVRGCRQRYRSHRATCDDECKELRCSNF